MRCGVALVLLVSITLGERRPAWAGEAAPAPTGEQQRALAEGKYQQGVEAYRAHRYADAVKLFLDADALSASAALSFNIARAYEKLGDDAATMHYYRNYLRLDPEAPNRAEVLQNIENLSEALAKKGIQQVTVLSTPPGATVAIDGQALGVTPLTVELPPGNHSALLTARGYGDAQRSFNLAAPTPMDLAFDLQPAATTPAPAASRSWPAKASGRRFGIAPFITIGAGVLALGGSAVFELSRRSAQNAASHEPEQLAFQRDVDTMNSRQTASRVLLGGGGALLVTGTTLLLLNTRVSAESQAVVAMLPGGAALSFSRSF